MLSTPPNPADVCAFCVRGLSHEGACLSEGDAYTSLGLLFTPTGLLLQPPEPLGPDDRPLSRNPESGQPLIRRKRRLPIIVRVLLPLVLTLTQWR